MSVKVEGYKNHSAKPNKARHRKGSVHTGNSEHAKATQVATSLHPFCMCMASFVRACCEVTAWQLFYSGIFKYQIDLQQASFPL